MVSRRLAWPLDKDDMQIRDAFPIFIDCNRKNKNLKKILRRKRIYIYMYITESLCCSAELNTILEIKYTSIKFKKYKWEFPSWLGRNKSDQHP